MPKQLEAQNHTFPSIPQSHIDQLNTLVVQSFDGRMKPFHSVATEAFNKIYRSSTYEGLDGVSAMLLMMIDGEYWRKLQLVKVKDKEIKRILSIPLKQKAASFDDFLRVRTASGLTNWLNTAKRQTVKSHQLAAFLTKRS